MELAHGPSRSDAPNFCNYKRDKSQLYIFLPTQTILTCRLAVAKMSFKNSEQCNKFSLDFLIKRFMRPSRRLVLGIWRLRQVPLTLTMDERILGYLWTLSDILIFYCILPWRIPQRSKWLKSAEKNLWFQAAFTTEREYFTLGSAGLSWRGYFGLWCCWWNCWPFLHWSDSQ